MTTKSPKAPITMIKTLQAIFLLMLLAAPGFAAENAVDPIKGAIEQLKAIENALNKGSLNVTDLNNTAKQLNEYKIQSDDCIKSAEDTIADKKTAAKALGEKKPNEPAEVKQERKDLGAALSQAETRLANCTALKLRASNLADQTELQRKEKLSAQLFAKNPDILTVIARNLEEPSHWWTDTFSYAKKHAWIHKTPARHLILLGVSLIIGIGAGILVRLRASRWIGRFHLEGSLGGRVVVAFISTACRDAPYILGSLVPAFYLGSATQDIKPLPLITALAYALTFFFIVRLMIRVSLNPVPPAKLFLNMKPEIGHALSQRFNVLLFVIVASFILLNSILVQTLPEHAQQLSRTILRLIFAINVLWVLWLFRYLTGVLQQAWFRFGLSLVLLVGIAADVVGYTNLAGWLFRAVFGSVVALTFVLLAGRIFKELLVGLEYGRNHWQQILRQRLGLDATGRIQGFFWIRLVVNAGLLLLLIWLLIVIWDLSSNAVQQLQFIFTQGFTIGSLNVVPSRILMALLSLGVLVAVSAWLKRRLQQNLAKTPMERGAREAIVTMSGYVGIAVAIIVALGIAGLDFSNLALIAGALSVGIGFGLQNIVNNFISGLILLFERPVKTGDWIVVGDTEGYVKRIRIRSTQIQTFDRADVIVPNAELISGQVTNWMLHDAMGRAVVPVGVAYGSNTQKVREILLKVAAEHPEVMSGANGPAPYVLFREFGDSSLNFELRCYIKNIDHRLTVISDLNFAIDAAFRDNGIEIPFPQRDLHVKNWPGKPQPD
jgi:small-conductance mechanosensitive channel